MKKIIFVSHCILNTASKVVLYDQEAIDSEEFLRRSFIQKTLDKDIQIIQLPCPEFTLYGSKRWGHVSAQFDNPFFKDHCRKILSPVLLQIKEYLAHPECFKVLGIVGIDGSPSCGVDYTCQADWYGSFEGREGLQETLDTCKLIKAPGIFVCVFKELLEEEGIAEQVRISSLFASEPEKCLEILE